MNTRSVAHRLLRTVGVASWLVATSLYAGADAGEDQLVNALNTVLLDGSASTADRRKGVLYSFNWTQLSGPAVALVNAQSVTPTFDAPAVDAPVVVSVRLITKERYRCRKSRCRVNTTQDTVDIAILPAITQDDPVNEAEPSASTVDESGFITHEGFRYLTVTSPHTGRIWLDRNLGANEACDTPTQPSCFGALYQWGRNSDGHQKRASKQATGELANLSVVDSLYRVPLELGDYTNSGDWVFGDNDGSLRQSRWQQTDGSSICPAGFRVPTIVELEQELFSDTSGRFLNLAYAGFRSYAVSNEAKSYDLWSSTPRGNNEAEFITNATPLFFIHQNYVARSVRCIKE